MSVTQLTTRQIGANGVNRDDLDTSTTTKAVITKAIAGTNISLGSTGVDSGTGDVTIGITGSIPIANGGLAKTSIATSKFPFSTNGTTYSEGTARQGAEQTYTITGSIVFTGTTAPSGTLTATYRWTQVLNLVFVRFFFTYAVSGSAITQVVFDLPADLPIPESPTGFTANNNIIALGFGGIANTLIVDPVASRATLHAASSSSTGYSVSIPSASSNTKAIEVFITYFTASGF